ncbi:DUF1351 domain-containing protein [uncultured Desulfovibrio sp.]|uniref:DUF1351 domain-containing protein n=1 Tax=uncultured Desulfovibrio sp. TaxID=167968 RepID=UPI0026DB153D|nr:DUF1351 domain-containing protein [uncultured Desulfovibrio sp.]
MSQQISATIDPALKLQTSLPAVSFDLEGLMAWATAMTEKYAGLVVSEDQVKDVKKDMAELNAAKIRVDNARKETVKILTAPIKDFEAQIKKVCCIFDDAYRALGEQVKDFEEKERDAKREVVKDLIDKELEAHAGRVRAFPIPVQDKWLNKSTSLKSVREAIRDIIVQRIETEALQRQAEQARQERAAAIEQGVKAANAEYGVSLAVVRFMTPGNMDLETPLSDVCRSIMDAARLEAEKGHVQAILQPQRQAMPAPMSGPPADAATPDKALSIILTYAPANERAVSFALEQLKKLCTSFGVRRR